MRPGRRQGGKPRRQVGEREKENTRSWMADHMMETYRVQKSEDPFEDFRFHQLRIFLKTLEIQVAESVFMEVAEPRGVVRMGPVLQKVGRKLCNRKGETFHFNPRGCWETGAGPRARGWGHREEEGGGRGSSRGATQRSGKPHGLASCEGCTQALRAREGGAVAEPLQPFLHHHLHLHPVTR